MQVLQFKTPGGPEPMKGLARRICLDMLRHKPLFVLVSAVAPRVIRVFRQIAQERKEPWRLLSK